MLGIGLGYGFVSGLIWGSVGGLSYGLVVGLSSGGAAYLEHYILRFILWRNGAMPWHYVQFLEEAYKRVLLQKVGGGYSFKHPLFLDYFASHSALAPLSSVQQPSVSNPQELI